MMNRLKNYIDIYFENYTQIALDQHKKQNEINIQKFDFNPSEKFCFIQEQLDKIKNENINVENFKNVYKEIFKVNADLR